MIPTSQKDDCVLFDVRVTPRASRAAILGVHEDALKVSLAAPPVDGAANAALCELLARELGVPQRAVTILRGHRSRTKTVSVAGVSPEQIAALCTPDESRRGKKR